MFSLDINASYMFSSLYFFLNVSQTDENLLLCFINYMLKTELQVK